MRWKVQESFWYCLVTRDHVTKETWQGALSQELLIITMCDLVTSSISGVCGQLDGDYESQLLFIELQWKLWVKILIVP